MNERVFDVLVAFEDKKISLAQARAQLKDAGVPEEETDLYLFGEDPETGESERT